MLPTSNHIIYKTKIKSLIWHKRLQVPNTNNLQADAFQNIVRWDWKSEEVLLS